MSLEELGMAMAKATQEHGDHPLFVLERGEITEAEFRAASSGISSPASTSLACAASTSTD